MTTIDYKEKYEQALEVAQRFYNNSIAITKKGLEDIFPELKESEDELARKEMLEYCYKRMNNEFPSITIHQVKRWLAWLEKQGEQKPTDKIQLGKIYKCIASPRYSTFRIGEIYKPEDKFLCSLMNFCSDCFEPIEHEQKPTDKVEPKFHKGEWITIKE